MWEQLWRSASWRRGMWGVVHLSIHQKERGDPSIIYPQHRWCSWGQLKYVEILKSLLLIRNDHFQMLHLDFTRFISQDATLKCGNDFLSLSTRVVTGSCTSDWLKFKARSVLGGRDLVRNRCHRYRGQINNRLSSYSFLKATGVALQSERVQP